MKLIAKLLIIAILLGCSRGSSFTTVTLDGLTLCIPSRYIRNAPSWLAEMPGLDNTYDDLWVIVPSAELLLSVPQYQPSTYPLQGGRQYMDLSILATNVSAISGPSGNQARLLEVGVDKNNYVWVPELSLYHVTLHETLRSWSFVRWIPEQGLPTSTQELHQWIAATCYDVRVNDSLTECAVQRIHGSLSYDYNITDNNLSNLPAVDSFVAGKFEEWETACVDGDSQEVPTGRNRSVTSFAKYAKVVLRQFRP